MKSRHSFPLRVIHPVPPLASRSLIVLSILPYVESIHMPRFSKATYAVAWQGRPTLVSGTRSPTFDLAPSPPSRSPPPMCRFTGSSRLRLYLSPAFFDYSLRRVLSFWLKVSTGELSNWSESILEVSKRDIAYCFVRGCLISSCALIRASWIGPSRTATSRRRNIKFCACRAVDCGKHGPLKD